MNWSVFVRNVRFPDNPDCAYVRQSIFPPPSYLQALLCAGPVFVRFVRIAPGKSKGRPLKSTAHRSVVAPPQATGFPTGSSPRGRSWRVGRVAVGALSRHRHGYHAALYAESRVEISGDLA